MLRGLIIKMPIGPMLKIGCMILRWEAAMQ